MRKLVTALLMCGSVAVYGQGLVVHDNVTTIAKNVPPGAQASIFTVPNAQVTVCDSTCSNPVTIYSDAGLTQPIQQPLIADSQGRFTYYVAPGSYFEQLSTSSGQLIATLPVQLQGLIGQIVAAPSLNQNVVQPAGTSFNINTANITNLIATTASTQVMNGVVNAALEPGSDLGAQVAAAQTQLAGDCGTILIPHGTYTWTTTVTLNPCMTLEGNGAIVNVPSTGTAPFLIIAGQQIINSYNSFNAHAYTQGALNNITFIGAGPTNTQTIGIWYGGDSTGVLTPSSYLAYLNTFTNVHITGFGTGLMYSSLGFQTTWFGGSIENNNVGIGFQTGVTGGLENLSFHGTEILNNILWGILQSDTSVYFELNCFGCSLDYNGQGNKTSGGAAQFENATANFYGGHFEGSTAPFIRLPVISYPNGGVELTLDTVDFNQIDTNAADTYDGFIENYGYGNSIILKGLNNFGSQGARISQIVYNSPSAGRPTTILADPYLATYMSAIPGFPSLYGGSTPDVYSYWTRSGQGVGVITGHVDNQPHSFTNVSVGGTLLATLLSTTHIGNNSGIQLAPAISGCTIAAGASSCTNTITLAYPEPSSTYQELCGVHGASGTVVVDNYANISATQFTVQTETLSSSTSATGGGFIQCTIMAN